MSLQLTSTAFRDGEPIPKQYTCEGDDISPPLAWSGVPTGTESLALIIDDPDAPDPAAPRMTWVHWVLYDISPETTNLVEGLIDAPPGARSGLNDWKRLGYGGPCPPIGRHRYIHKLYALNRTLGDLRQPTKSDVELVMKDHVLADAVLIGTYRKTQSR